MKETETLAHPLPTLEQERQRIIDSILQDGLISAEGQVKQGNNPFGSSDKTKFGDECDLVVARILYNSSMMIFPQYKEDLSVHTLWNVLYVSGWGCLSVACERDCPPLSTTHLETEYSQRARSTFLITGTDEFFSPPLSDPPMLAHFGDSEIQVKDIDSIIIPQNLKPLFQNVPSTINCIEIADEVTRSIDTDEFYGKIPVPNYEGYLRKLYKTLSKPLWIHAVRLPTEEDLARIAR